MNNKYKILCVLLAFIFLFPIFIHAKESNSPKEMTVVIDPGHGGKDPGAVGRISKEKDIVLEIAILLRDFINNAYNDVNVILTREDDSFVELFKRAEIANKNNADLFISLHINGSSNRRANGTETFVMGLHTSKENLEVAKKENAVILKEEDYEDRYGGFDPNDPESHIIFSLFQDAHLNQSLFMSQLVQENFANKLPLTNRGVKQAGFLVLWQTTMPSVLVEAGFISNAEEEKLLNTSETQEKIAYSIFNAFSKYRKYYQDDDIDIAEKDFSEILADEASASKTTQTSIEKENISVTEPKSESSIIFKVQIATSSRKIETIPQNFKSHKNVEVYLLDNIYRYTIGTETNYDKILQLRSDLSKDFPDCFVVAFKNGERISIQEAKKELNIK